MLYIENVSESNDYSRLLKVHIKITSKGVNQVELEPWPEQEFFPSSRYRVRIFLQAEDKCAFHEMLQEDLKAYFSGHPVDFLKYPVDYRSMTSFSRKVLDLARSIPWGETRNYGWLSEQLGLHGGARAVGGALSRNPVALIVPCHRVLRKDGQVWGFSAGIPWKRFLLNLESPLSSHSGNSECIEQVECIEVME